ncbi:putative MFS-type transporter [Chishuiella changwenlii]|uniref:MFS-type transporter n=2 Tax=Chishuiella changwenlii TaxID=1434701 RepID=A0ABQ1TI24_9FLAO|nr:putative MFS-type transporter [Chishuiella changwenlii]
MQICINLQHVNTNKIFMNSLKKIKKAKIATQLIFLVCGLGLSSWAPMVPIVKNNLNLNEANLGVVLLMLGLGALIMMPISGYLINRFGSRKIIAIGTIVIAITLPVLLITPSYYGILLTLFVFGCGVGTVDVAMNSHGIQVQNTFEKQIMSSLHGLFSVGGIIGSLGLGLLIKMGLSPLLSAIVISITLIILIISQYKNLFDYQFEKDTINRFIEKTEKEENNNSKSFQWLNKTVLLLGFMCFTVFLSEGAMLDWSALFLKNTKSVAVEFAGIGYAFFSISMAIMRLLGDKLVEKLNSKIIVIGGSILSIIGLFFMVFSFYIPLVLIGFVLLGIGASNIVPIFFSEGGRISGISPNISIPAITTMGYAGQLVGPALLGFIAHLYTMEIAFITIAGLMLLVAIIYSLKK